MNQEALDKVINGTRDERLFLCEESFGLFAIYYFTDYFEYSLAPYHYDMCQDVHDLISGKIREVAWIMFRESAKTTFAKLFIIWMICYKKRKYINVDSFDKENAERILFDIAFEMVNNKRLIADYGELFSRRKTSIDDIKQNRINNFVTQNGIRVEAHSTQESIRGRIHLNQRPDFLLLDDFETNKTKDSAAYTKQILNHITEAMGGLAVNGIMLYLSNYISEYGNVQWIFDRAKDDPKLRVRNIPVIINEQPVWPAKYAMTDQEAIKTGKVSLEDKKRQLGSYVFSYEMMNTPVDEALAEFKKSWLQYTLPNVLDHMTYHTYITIDTAVSKKESADFTGITINKVTRENKWYVRAYRIKMNSRELIDHIFFLWDTYKPVEIGIEETVFLLAIKPFFDEACRERGKFIRITPLKHNQTNKETRIRGLIPRFETGSIFFFEPNKDLIEEMRTFPNGQHDDILDSCFIGETIVLSQRGNIPIKDILTGDYVMTRSGYKRVLNSWCTGEKEVISNIGLIGTPNHPVITTDGVIELRYVDQSSKLYVWNEKLLNIEERNITEILNQRDDSMRSIFGDMMKIKKHLSLYIDKSGLIRMVRFLRGFIYTTRTGIHSIIQLKTYNVFHLSNMLTITAKTRQELSSLEYLPQSVGSMQNYGMDQKKELNGIKIMFSKVFWERKFKGSVLNVIYCIKQELKWRLVTVQKNVGLVIREENLEKGTQVTTQQPVRRKEKVYNLEVEDVHEYFANGILVHNCAYQLQIARPPYNGNTEEAPKKPINKWGV